MEGRRRMRKRCGSGCVRLSSRVGIGGYVGFGGQERGRDLLWLGRAAGEERRRRTWWG